MARDMTAMRRHRAGEQPRPHRPPSLAAQRRELIADLMRRDAGPGGIKLATRRARELRPDLFEE